MTEQKGHIMWQEIHEQPQAIADTLAAEDEHIDELAARLREEKIQQVILVARGTSDHAATYARYLFSQTLGLLISSLPSSLFTVYGVELDLSNILVMGISQSGRSSDVVDVLTMARDQGALTAALTNTPGSPIFQAADVTMLTRASKEQSIPATKTYTAALAVLHQLAAHWAQDQGMVDSIAQVPDLMAQIFAQEAHIQAHAERYRFLDRCILIGRGLNFCTAHETALKLGECAQIVPASYSAADFLHGPIAMVQQDVPCFIIAPEGEALGSMLEVVTALAQREAEMLTIANEPVLLELADVAIPLPADMPEHLSPLIAVVAGQLLAYYIARHKGLDPDRPALLGKITLTR